MSFETLPFYRVTSRGELRPVPYRRYFNRCFHETIFFGARNVGVNNSPFLTGGEYPTDPRGVSHRYYTKGVYINWGTPVPSSLMGEISPPNEQVAVERR